MLAIDSSPHHVVFITGFMCDARLFTPQVSTLSQTRTSYSIETMIAGSTMREFALHILQTAPARFALTGLSMGGIVALEIMRMAPERISHLALVNTTPHEDRSREQRQDHIHRAQNGELRAILRDELKPRYLSPHTSHAALQPLIMDMGEALGVGVFVKQSIALMARKSAWGTLSRINCPVVIISGRNDVICSPKIQEEMAKEISNSRLHILPHCGHISTLEAPEAVTQILFEHLGLILSNTASDQRGHDAVAIERLRG